MTTPLTNIRFFWRNFRKNFSMTIFLAKFSKEFFNDDFFGEIFKRNFQKRFFWRNFRKNFSQSMDFQIDLIYYLYHVLSKQVNLIVIRLYVYYL